MSPILFVRNRIIPNRREASEMELLDVSSEVVADNTDPVTAIPINSPRGESI